MTPKDREEFAVIKLKVENIEKSNEKQNCKLEKIDDSLESIKNSMFSLNEWKKHKDETDNRQDDDLVQLWKTKASQKSIDSINGKLWAIISAILIGIIGYGLHAIFG